MIDLLHGSCNSWYLFPSLQEKKCILGVLIWQNWRLYFEHLKFTSCNFLVVWLMICKEFRGQSKVMQYFQAVFPLISPGSLNYGIFRWCKMLVRSFMVIHHRWKLTLFTYMLNTNLRDGEPCTLTECLKPSHVLDTCSARRQLHSYHLEN